MKKLMLMAAVLILFVTPGVAQKTAVVNYNDIFQSMPEAKHADTSMRILRAQYINMLQAKQIEFTKKYKHYDSTYGLMSKEIQAMMQKDLANMNKDYQSLQLGADSTLNVKSKEMLAPVYKKLNMAITAVSKSKGLAQVWDIGTNGLIYADEMNNITAEVKKYLGIK